MQCREDNSDGKAAERTQINGVVREKERWAGCGEWNVGRGEGGSIERRWGNHFN